MKILSIGDIHGRNVWKKFEDIPQLITYSGFEPDYDYYVFVGDYTDSFSKSNSEIFQNLKDLIEFKKNYPNNVVLLLGNHDMQYLTSYGENGCSGFRPEAYFDLHELFRENRTLFQLAFQYKNYLWTHAGVHRGWYQFDFPFNTGENVAENLNLSFEQNTPSIFTVGRSRGGWGNVGGPLWADKSETWSKPLKGYHQIVGHTRLGGGEFLTNKLGRDTSITYIDILEDGGGKPYILEI